MVEPRTQKKETTTMKKPRRLTITDQDNNPIATDAETPTTTPVVPVLPPVMGTTSADDVTGATSTEDVSESNDKRLSPRDQMVARLRHIRERLLAYADQVSDRPSVMDSMLNTAQACDMAIAGAAVLPPDWTPVRTTAKSAAALTQGDHVVVRSKYRSVYADDLSPEDMDDMVITRVGEKRLRCHCAASGVQVFMPARHVDRR